MMETATMERAEGGGGGAWLINHLPTILWQRRWYMIVPAVAIFAAAVLTAFLLPTLYRSSATLLVENQQLPTAVVDDPGNGQIELRIARIREQVLSRGDLISLIEQNDLYSSERRSKPMSYVVEKMRAATTIGALENDIGQGGGTNASNTIAVTMSFDYPEPSKAQAVMQSYVTQFLRMDSDEVEDQANLTVRFLSQQAGKLQTQISAIESQITAIKSSNGAVLAGTGVPFTDTGSYSAQIATLESENRRLLAQARGTGATSALGQAEAQLAALRATLSENHPDVAQARERVAILRQSSQAGDAATTSAVQDEIRANNAQIAQLRALRDEQISRVNAAMAGQARAPAIMERAMQLENQASGLREQYRNVAANLTRAQASARLANEQRAERLSLVEPPSYPDRPHWPNRPLVIAAGALAGLGLGFVLAMLVELLNRPMRSPAQLQGMGYPVLGVVPILQNKPAKKRFGFLRKREAGLA